MSRWMGGPDATAPDRLADEYILTQCSTRPTLDVGCGPGRFAAALQHCGRPALGVDNSAVAVELTRRRGGVALFGDLSGPLPGGGGWDRVLLADGNIGIGGDRVRTVRRAVELLSPGGAVIVELDPPRRGLSQEMLRWETGDHRAMVSVVACRSRGAGWYRRSCRTRRGHRGGRPLTGDRRAQHRCRPAQ